MGQKIILNKDLQVSDVELNAGMVEKVKGRLCYGTEVFLCVSWQDWNGGHDGDGSRENEDRSNVYINEDVLEEATERMIQ